MKFLYNLIRKQFRVNLWVIPALMGLAGCLLGIFLLWWGSEYESSIYSKFLKNIDPQDFSRTLSILLGAMVTVFGILLPITFSILLRASSQFTPMILRIFRSAVRPKLFLGLMFGTVVYLMTLLIGITHFAFFDPSFMMILFAFILIGAVMYSIPAFFDHFVTSVEPTYFVAAIAKDLNKMLSELKLPEEEAHLETDQNRDLLDPNLYSTHVLSLSSGYLQSIDLEEMTQFLSKISNFGAVPVRPGDFVLKGSVLIYLKYDEKDAKWNKDHFHQFFNLGKRRMDIADLELQLDELNAIVLKALSPGINDVSTALQCLNQMGVVCNEVVNRSFPSGKHLDNNKVERLFTKEFDFKGFVHSAFDRIRQNTQLHLSVSLHILRTLEHLVDHCKSKDRAKILLEISSEIKERASKTELHADKEKLADFFASIEKTYSSGKSAL
ncbi:MAG: DUF2254 family protein [Chlamydiales bacterium]